MVQLASVVANCYYAEVVSQPLVVAWLASCSTVLRTIAVVSAALLLFSMPREYKPRCCKDKALAVALFEEPRTPIRKKRKRHATVNSETTNKAAAVAIPTPPHPKGRILKKQNRVSVRLNENVHP